MLIQFSQNVSAQKGNLYEIPSLDLTSEKNVEELVMALKIYPERMKAVLSEIRERGQSLEIEKAELSKRALLRPRAKGEFETTREYQNFVESHYQEQRKLKRRKLLELEKGIEYLEEKEAEGMKRLALLPRSNRLSIQKARFAMPLSVGVFDADRRFFSRLVASGPLRWCKTDSVIYQTALSKPIIVNGIAVDIATAKLIRAMSDKGELRAVFESKNIPAAIYRGTTAIDASLIDKSAEIGAWLFEEAIKATAKEKFGMDLGGPNYNVDVSSHKSAPMIEILLSPKNSRLLFLTDSKGKVVWKPK